MTAAPSPLLTSTPLRRARSSRHAAVLVTSLAAALASLPAATQSPPSPSVAPATSMSDQSIRADQQSYIAQQANIKAVNDSGRHRVASYSLAKAQCWLDVSFHEWSRNDRSAFPQLALTESNKITRYLSGGGEVASSANPANQTPLVNDSARLRPDLWERTQALKGHSGYRCVERQVACAEVELVHAGNEFNQQGWRHAKPYVQIAEDLVGEAAAGAAACPAPPPPAPPPAPPVAPVVVPPPPPPPPPLATTRVEAQVLFYFDRSDTKDILPETRQRLDNLAAEVTGGRVTPTRILLSGHADISNFTRDAQYNRRLADRRVDTVRDYLVAKGIDWRIIATESKSDTVQVQSCEQVKNRRSKAWEDCLQPNRRVEVVLEGTLPRR